MKNYCPDRLSVLLARRYDPNAGGLQPKEMIELDILTHGSLPDQTSTEYADRIVKIIGAELARTYENEITNKDNEIKRLKVNTRRMALAAVVVLTAVSSLLVLGLTP